MNILLITTSPNGILDKLQVIQNVCLKVVDCKQFIERSKKWKEVKYAILSAITDMLNHCEPDIIITYRCPCILPKKIFSRAKKIALNIHPSLLPKYSGANPWEGIYQNQEKESGVTIHRIDEGVDTGTIILQRKIKMNFKKDIKWHQVIIEELAYEMLDNILLSLDNTNDIYTENIKQRT